MSTDPTPHAVQRGMTLKLPEDLWRKLQAAADKDGVTVNRIIEQSLLRAFYDDETEDG